MADITVRARIPVGVLGATGLVGQQLLALLEDHPWFVADELFASPAHQGRELCNSGNWLIGGQLPAGVAHRRLKPVGEPCFSPVIFSALPGGMAAEAEACYARAGHLVCSNSSAWRDDPEVPLVIPEVNAEGVGLLSRARAWSGSAVAGNGTVSPDWDTIIEQFGAELLLGGGPPAPTAFSGGIITNPNCVVAGLVLALYPLHRAATISRVNVVTLQSLSGAGRAALAAGESRDNVLPGIPGEGAKIARESRRLLELDAPIVVATNRVPVSRGHLAAVTVDLVHPVSPEEATLLWRSFRPPDLVAGLPSSPDDPISVSSDPIRPQPALDLSSDGMQVPVGQVTSDGNVLSFTLLVDNLIRGAAGAALLNAELAMAYLAGSPDGMARPIPPPAAETRRRPAAY